MQVTAFDERCRAAAAGLLADRHQRERRVFPALPRGYETDAQTAQALAQRMNEGATLGVCAHEGERLCGFLLAELTDEPMWGPSAHIGYDGMAISADVSPEAYRVMYAELAMQCVARGVLNHYALTPLGDRAAAEAWLRLSFAYQQVYAIKTLAQAAPQMPDGVTVRPADRDDAGVMRGMAHLIYTHQAASPTYAAMPPQAAERIQEGYGELTQEEGTAVWLAYCAGQPAGFICVETQFEDDMMMPDHACEISVCGVQPAFRHMGIARALSQIAQNEMAARGYRHMRADWRMANLNASVFWERQGFQPFASRMFRPIDERVYLASGQKG